MAQEAPGIEYLCGTMIELPRAALCADEIAREAEFFSFGTNDLTQTALGLSRDDAEGKFLTTYLESGVIEDNPFETLDQEGVGELIRIGVSRGRAAIPGLKIGICGEHGGDPRSIAFCHKSGLDYVSCSPFRLSGGEARRGTGLAVRGRGPIRGRRRLMPAVEKWRSDERPCCDQRLRPHRSSSFPRRLSAECRYRMGGDQRRRRTRDFSHTCSGTTPSMGRSPAKLRRRKTR